MTCTILIKMFFELKKNNRKLLKEENLNKFNCNIYESE